MRMAALAHPALVGFAVTALVGFAIVATRRLHSATTADRGAGPQKFHDSSTTPRIGGLAVLVGYGAAISVSPAPARDLLLGAGAGAGLALLGGLAEDFTRRVHPAIRLTATVLAGLAFCLLTGYVVDRVELALVDDLMAVPVVALGFTALAMAVMAHAINMIDGFHGLAAGTAMILLSAFLVVCLAAGDGDLVLLCLVGIGVVAGFAVLNFPFGRMFLGDGGAYFVGLMLACIAVMMPARNPEISPWISLVVLAYPLLEVAFSFVRKVCAGASPFRPDRRHLHMLAYERLGTRLAHAAGAARLANPVTGMLMWSGPLASLLAVTLIAPHRKWAVLACVLLSTLYVMVYWKLARMSSPDVPSREPCSRRPAAPRDRPPMDATRHGRTT